MWMPWMREHHPQLASAFECLLGDAGQRHVLPAPDRELILVGLHAAHGAVAEVEEHGRLALAAGALPQALQEAVLTAAISRGPRAILTARVFLSTLLSGRVRQRASDKLGDPIAYFAAEFGTLPEWARRLAEFSPASFESYAVLRGALLADGAASRATKELLTMCLNAIDNGPGGVRSHAAAALRCGAPPGAVLDALLLTVRLGGIVVWINGVEAVSDLLAASDPPGPRHAGPAA